jgi:hypothetical protein
LVVGAHQLQRLALDQRILLLLERRSGLAEALGSRSFSWQRSIGQQSVLAVWSLKYGLRANRQGMSEQVQERRYPIADR